MHDKATVYLIIIYNTILACSVQNFTGYRSLAQLPALIAIILNTSSAPIEGTSTMATPHSVISAKHTPVEGTETVCAVGAVANASVSVPKLVITDLEQLPSDLTSTVTVSHSIVMVCSDSI